MMSKTSSRKHRGRYRKDSLKWAARMHGRPVHLLDKGLPLTFLNQNNSWLIKGQGQSGAISHGIAGGEGVAFAVVKYNRGFLEVHNNISKEVLDRLAGREPEEGVLIEYRDRSRISQAKGERSFEAPPPELERLVRFWNANRSNK